MMKYLPTFVNPINDPGRGTDVHMLSRYAEVIWRTSFALHHRSQSITGRRSKANQHQMLFIQAFSNRIPMRANYKAHSPAGVETPSENNTAEVLALLSPTEVVATHFSYVTPG